MSCLETVLSTDKLVILTESAGGVFSDLLAVYVIVWVVVSFAVKQFCSVFSFYYLY